MILETINIVVATTKVFRAGLKLMSKRHAILISNSVYDLEDLNLETPDNDIAAVEHSLLSRGFTVDKYHNLKIQCFENIFENLRNSPKYELLFFYYSGHALEINGRGYLLPVDLSGKTAYQIAMYTYHLDKLLMAIEKKAKAKVVVLDSCRNRVGGWEDNDYTSFASHIGFEPNIDTYKNLAIAYSTSSGAKAFEGQGISLYAKNLSEYILKHNIGIDDVFKTIGAKVTKLSPADQRPWFYSCLDESLTFGDLPNYEYVHAIRTPFSGEEIGISLLDRKQVVYGNFHAIFAVNQTYAYNIYKLKEEIILGVDYSSNTGLVLAIDDNSILVGNTRVNPDFDFRNFRCIQVSPNGKYTILVGMTEFVILDNINFIEHKEVIYSDNLYVAKFIDDYTVWIGSDNGVHSVSLAGNGIVYNNVDIDSLLYVYAIDVIDSETVTLSCSSGNIFFVNNKTFEVKRVLSLGETVRSFSTRRDSLIHITNDDQLIQDFLYKPWTLDRDANSFLKEHLSDNAMVFIKVSPIDPLIVAASDEGILYFIDYRTFDAYETISVGTPQNKIQGVSFEPDGNILILTNDGFVHFYCRGETDHKQAVKYVDKIGTRKKRTQKIAQGVK